MDDTSLSYWLGLREQADWTARPPVLAQTIAAALPRDQPVCVLDLGTGAGSNLRYLVERLPEQQHWLVIDRSPALLSEVNTRTKSWAAERGHAVGSDAKGFTLSSERLDCRVEVSAQDLGTLHDPSIFAGRHLVTASALLDLVSETWLQTLASRCRSAGAAALFTITYDGRSSCLPAEPEDELVRGLMNTHQRRDKGLGGPAAGPDATACAERCFVAEGYRVTSEATDWVLGPGDA
ncbi:MAG: class I SAM-dependent methyltransferase, partial [Acidobacteria bacterium]|nr:class I SAM-dependent methyltransferase [Acidobacteriota bacterium]